jgi:exonuclease VII small subunit
MANESVTTAIHGVSDAIDTNTQGQTSMGIKGLLWNNIGNVAAMAIIAGSFLYLGNDYVNQSKEDRAMFREELKAIRTSQETRWEKTDTTHAKSFEKMGMTIDRAVTSMENSSKSMETAVTELKNATRMVGKVGDKINPPQQDEHP